jgi:hypothetical protein
MASCRPRTTAEIDDFGSINTLTERAPNISRLRRSKSADSAQRAHRMFSEG